VRFLLVLAVCLATVVALIYAQDAPSTGSIYGYVLSTDQEVIGDALVEIASGTSRQGATVRSRGRDSVYYDGGFFIPMLSPGTYSIKVSHEKYAPHTYESLAVEAGKGIFVVAELDSLSEIAGSIKGSVSIKGGSVKDMIVQYWKEDGKESLASVTLADDGKYEFEGVLPGNYVVVVLKGREEVYRSEPLQVAKKKGLTHRIKLSPEEVLEEPGSISGKIAGSDYKAIEGASISFSSAPPGQKKVSAKSDENGKFELQNLRPGSYEIQASKTGFETETKRVTVRSGRGSKVSFYLKKN
jgi:hypothetical protein